MADETTYEEGARAPKPDPTYKAPNPVHTGDPADEPKRPYGLTEPVDETDNRTRHSDGRRQPAAGRAG